MDKPIMIYVGNVATIESIIDVNKDRFDLMMFVDCSSALRVFDLMGPKAASRVAVVAVEDKVGKEPRVKNVNGNIFSIVETLEDFDG